MKNFRTFIFPAVAAGAASLLTSGAAWADNVFVVNNGNSTVSQISDGVISTFIATDLNSPTGIAIDSTGNFYIANNGTGAGNGYIEEFSSNGTVIGQYASGFNNPRGIAFDSAGNLYVADQGSHSIMQIPVGGGSSSVYANGFSAVNYVAFDSNTLYASDGPGGVIDTTPGGNPSPYITGLNSPNGFAFDSAGNLFVVEHGSNAITEFPAGSTLGSNFIQQTSADGPKAIAIDTAGNFFITDNSNNTVAEYDKNGALVETFTSPDFSGPCYITTQLAVPEPATYVLLLAGFGALYFLRRQKSSGTTV